MSNTSTAVQSLSDSRSTEFVMRLVCASAILLALTACGGGGGGGGGSAGGSTDSTAPVNTITQVQVTGTVDEASTVTATGYDALGAALTPVADDDSTVDTAYSVTLDADDVDLAIDPGATGTGYLEFDVDFDNSSEATTTMFSIEPAY